jgi:GMP synthase PP-ATPase subunit
MSLLDTFNEEFVKRHDFEDSDIDVFINRWKNKAIFKNIPLAWIVPLDTMMFELNKRNYVVKSINQEYGQLIVTVPADHNALKAFKIIDVARDKVKDIDKDLYLLFDIDIGKEYSNKRHNDQIEKFHEKDSN